MTKIKNRSFLRLLTVSFILTAMSLVVLINCQDPVEPVKPDLMTLFVKVTDESNMPVRNATIFLAKGIDLPSNELANLGVTDDNGWNKIQMEISCDGEVFTMEVNAPYNDPELSGKSQRFADMLLYCCDDTVYVTFSREKELECDQLIESVIKINYCLDTASSKTVCSPIFTNSTGYDLSMVFNAAVPALPGGLTADVSGSGITPATITYPAANTFDIATGGNFQACFTLASQTPVDYQGEVNFYGLLATGDTCIRGTIDLTASAEQCDNCACPTQSYNLTKKDTVCVGSVENIEVDLSKTFKNTSLLDCELILTLTNPVQTSDLSLLSINNLNPTYIVLEKGESLQKLVARFSPKSRQAYKDTIVYSVQMKNSFGEISDCGQSLSIYFDLFGGAPECYIAKNTISTIPQCVNSVLNKDTLCISNVGECPLPIDMTIFGNDSDLFEIEPADTVILPGETVCFDILFMPQTDDVWPNGRSTQPVVLNFTTNLRVNSPESSCPTTDYVLTGVADTSCGGLELCLIEYTWLNLYYGGLQMNVESNSLIYTETIQQTKLDIFASDVNVGSSTATLESGTGGVFIYVGNRSLQSTERICAAVDGIAMDLCNNPPGTADITIDVASQDLILYKSASGTCSLIWIDTILNDGTNPGNPRICMKICTPIN